MKSIVIDYKGLSYQMDLIVGEHLDEAYHRLWKIVTACQHHPLSDYDYEQLVELSKIWHHKQRLGCTYSADIEARLKAF
jgi:hypothetical protein